MEARYGPNTFVKYTLEKKWKNNKYIFPNINRFFIFYFLFLGKPKMEGWIKEGRGGEARASARVILYSRTVLTVHEKPRPRPSETLIDARRMLFVANL